MPSFREVENTVNHGYRVHYEQIDFVRYIRLSLVAGGNCIDVWYWDKENSRLRRRFNVYGAVSAFEHSLTSRHSSPVSKLVPFEFGPDALEKERKISESFGLRMGPINEYNKH